MGSKSAQNVMLMPNLLLDYVCYNVNLCILVLFWVGSVKFGAVARMTPIIAELASPQTLAGPWYAGSAEDG